MEKIINGKGVVENAASKIKLVSFQILAFLFTFRVNLNKLIYLSKLQFSHLQTHLL